MHLTSAGGRQLEPGEPPLDLSVSEVRGRYGAPARPDVGREDSLTGLRVVGESRPACEPLVGPPADCAVCAPRIYERASLLGSLDLDRNRSASTLRSNVRVRCSVRGPIPRVPSCARRWWPSSRCSPHAHRTGGSDVARDTMPGLPKKLGERSSASAAAMHHYLQLTTTLSYFFRISLEPHLRMCLVLDISATFAQLRMPKRIHTLSDISHGRN